MNSTVSEKEFIGLAAMMISLVALSIDAMLPALPAIANSFSVDTPNQQQQIITSIFLGLGVGQLLYGPLSDAYGRRPIITIGMLIFFCGTLLCLFSKSYSQMLMGRFLQGLGAASPRIVTMAIIRDRFEGVVMARILSFVMAIFILVPALAPLLGQGILLIGDWPSIFSAIFIFAGISFSWFYFRQPETLTTDRRTPFNPVTLWKGVRFIAQQKASLGAMLVLGLLFSGFVAYLSCAQQIFVGYYHTGIQFPLYFAGLALSIGFASLFNARLVARFGVQTVCLYALIAQAIITALLLVLITFGFHEQPPLWLFLIGSATIFICFGLQFGNLNSIAIQPLGAIAGLAASMISSGSTLIAVPLGALLGQAYDGTPLPLLAGFGLFSLLGAIAFYFCCYQNQTDLRYLE